MSTTPLSDDELQAVANRIIDQAYSDGFDTLSHADFVLLSCWTYAGELDNGGHEQFFFNSGGDFTPETVDALREVGLVAHSDRLREAARTIFGDSVPRDLEARNEILDSFTDDSAHEGKLGRLDKLYFESGGGDSVYDALKVWYPGAAAN